MDHNGVKKRINENLAHVVKELQKECPTGSPVLSESLVAQCLCNIIESAFIHGLKSTYIEKDYVRSRDKLPKPQFWNIVLKISHTETVKRVNELKLITTKVGKCRAWLRLILNDNAVTSYLAMLLSRDQKSLRSTYYHNHALLLDDERSEIFFGHLTGIEALPFDLGFNSSILNDWTRTPLELAALIPPSSSVPLYMTIQSKATKQISPSRCFISKHRASAPAALSDYSKSLPSVGTDEWNGPFGADTGKENSPKIQEPILEEPEEKGNEEDAVLHERKLLKRRRKSKGLKGSWTSLYSAGSTSTYGSTPSPRDTPFASPRATPRSGSFCEIPPVVTLQRRASVMKERSDSKSPSPTNCDETMVASKNTEFTSCANNGKISSTNEDFVQFDMSPIQDEPSCSPQGDATDNGTSNSGLSSRKNSMEGDKKSADQNISKTSSSNQNISKTDGDIPTNLSENVAAMDIYSSSIQPKPVVTPNLDDSIGNSLSQDGGWSRPVATSESTKSLKIEPSPSPTRVSSIEEPHEPIKWSTPENFSAKVKFTTVEIDTRPEIFIRREGTLFKLGGTLQQWKERWAVLRGKSLSYYTNSEASKPIATIDLVDVATISQNKSEFTITMNLIKKKRVKHYFKSGDITDATGWVTDIELMMKGAKIPETKTELFEDIYATNYIEEWEIITPADPVFTAPPTSWRASMVSLMPKMPNERGLDSQFYQCADCTSPIGIIHGPPRVCGFTGQYYCSQCHNNEETQIPARIIRNWDFRKYKVAKQSKTFLEQVFSEPHINMFEVNPGVYKYIDEMGKILQLRQKLVHLKSYLQTCRSFDFEGFRKKLGSRPHFLEDCHLYSVQDLCNVNDKSLANELTKIVNNGTKHVYNCALCLAKGFICEECKNDKVIFPFEVDKTVQCFECKGVFHRDCKNKTCPRCDRRQQRILKGMEQADQQDLEADSI